MNKKDLRSTYKQKRKTLNQSTIENLSLQIANQALKLPIWNASFFHIFLTIKHLKEIETEPLISILFGKDKNVVIPKSNISTSIIKRNSGVHKKLECPTRKTFSGSF